MIHLREVRLRGAHVWESVWIWMQEFMEGFFTVLHQHRVTVNSLKNDDDDKEHKLLSISQTNLLILDKGSPLMHGAKGIFSLGRGM